MNRTTVGVAARRANDHPALTALARLGYAASGVLHLVLAFIALQVAWSTTSTSADQSGALATLASSPLGQAALWVVALGFVGLAVWQASEAAVSGGETTDRVKAAAKAVLYAVLAWTALTVARGAPSSGTDQSQDLTTDLMAAPGGRILVAVVGLAVVGVGGYHVVKGWKRGFLDDLAENPGRFVTAAGRFGYIAKGIALAVVGGLFVAAARHARPDEAGGLDTAFRTLADQPFGTALLTVVAAGFAAYGVYSFGRARYART